MRRDRVFRSVRRVKMDGMGVKRVKRDRKSVAYGVRRVGMLGRGERCRISLSSTLIIVNWTPHNLKSLISVTSCVIERGG